MFQRRSKSRQHEFLIIAKIMEPASQKIHVKIHHHWIHIMYLFFNEPEYIFRLLKRNSANLQAIESGEVLEL